MIQTQSHSALVDFCKFLSSVNMKHPVIFRGISAREGTQTQAHVASTYTHAHTQDKVGNAMLTCAPCTHEHVCTHALTHASTPPSCSPHHPAVLPPDLPQLQDVKHGLKDPHAHCAAPPGGPESPCRRRWGGGCVNRGSIRGVLRRRIPAALVAVLGA